MEIYYKTLYENLGVCKGPGKVLGEIKIGSDSINISKNGRHFYVLLNNRIIMAAKSQKVLSERVVPVLSLIIENICKKAQLDAARYRHMDKEYTEMVTETIKGISDNLGAVDIYLLKAKPDETQTNRSILSSEKKGIVEKLNDYRLSLKKFEETTNELKSSSEILLRTNLDKKIWGSKEVMNVINGVKSEMEILASDYENIDGCLEHSDDQAYKIQAIISKKYVTNNIRKIAGKIVENFAVLKSFSSEFAQVLHRLNSIDRVFKASVGYPATWFLNGSTFMDFTFEYDNLINHVIKFAALESDVVESLLIWKIKLTGAKENVR